MSLILGLLVLALLISVLLGKPRAGKVFSVFLGVLILGTLTGPIPWLLQKSLVTHYEEPSASYSKPSVFIVLGAGLITDSAGQVRLPFYTYSRLFEAAKAYSNCKKTISLCTVLLSGGPSGSTPTTEASLMAKEITSIGVDAADLVLEDKSRNTWQNASFTRDLLENRKNDDLYLITSNLHMDRSLIYFEHFGLKPAPIAADRAEAKLSVGLNPINFLIADTLTHELIGKARYNLYNVLGLNDPKP